MNKEICLLCTKNSKNCVNIYKNPKGDLKYIDILNEVISDVVLPENIPVKICKKCSVELKEFYLYKKKCIGSIEQWKTLTEAAENTKRPSRKRGHVVNEVSKTKAKKEKLIEFVSLKSEPQVNMDEKTETSNLSTKINISALKRKLELNINKNIPVEPNVSKLSNNLNVKIESTENSEEEFVEETEPNVQKNTLSLLSNLNVSILKKKLGSALQSANNKRKDSCDTTHLDTDCSNCQLSEENYENIETSNEKVEEVDGQCKETDEQYEEMDEQYEDSENEIEEAGEQSDTSFENSTHESNTIYVNDESGSDTSAVFGFDEHIL